MGYYLLVVVLGWVAVALFVAWREPRLLYYPLREIEATPAQISLLFEDVWLTARDGVRLHGWYVPASNTSAATVLFLHGNAGNISHRLEKLALFHGLGVNTLILDYRGYGQSAGTPNERGTYLDAQAGYDWLTQLRSVPSSSIIAYGESLGAAVAVELAVTNTVAGVVLEEPFTSVAEVGQKLFPYLPVRLLVRNKYNTLSKMARLRSPLLIFHSRDDEMFPYAYAERLLAAAPGPKRLVELRGSHNDAFLVSATVYRQALAEFLTARR
jgi:fermentation-respiration switch protein FrsA (DUF1100 family)